jgi:superfamily II DNA or RNA helicase
MRASVRYDRAVGFFSSSALSIAAKGLPAFIEGAGTMRLLASPLLSAEDIQAIRTGYDERDRVVEAALCRELTDPATAVERDRLGFLAWLVATSRLDVKLAMRVNPATGIYHEKLGLFVDADGDFVAFTGSPNESASGFVSNFESVDVFCSWREADSTRAEDKRIAFDRLWEGQTSGLTVLPFPEAAARDLLKLRPEAAPTRDPNQDVSDTPVTLRSYQSEVIDAWLRSRGRGIVKLATGTGKTITAIALIGRLARKRLVQAAVVVVPFTHLVEQWATEVRRFGLRPIRCYQSATSWLPRAMAIAQAPGEPDPLPVFVVTNATFRGGPFQALLNKLSGNRTILVGDEVHNLGAANLRDALPEHVAMRLGLSATPERFMDPEGTGALFAYFGDELEPQVTVRDAIEMGALTRYDYHTHIVELTDDEFAEYEKLSAQIAQTYGRAVEEGSEEDGLAEALLMKRARILAGAARKPDQLVALLRPEARALRHALIYVGEARISNDPTLERQIEHVTRIIGGELGMRVRSFTAETPTRSRAEILRQLDEEELQAVIAMRCLDEGVDVPSIQVAYILSSSRNPRQYVQRRGRILRRSPGKVKSIIHDFLLAPPALLERDDASWGVGRELVRRELERVGAFCDDAANGSTSWHALSALRGQYDLMSM